MKKTVIYIIVAVIALVGLASLREYLSLQAQEKERSDSPYAEPVSDDDPLLDDFARLYGDAEVILACSDDVNADGKNDLIVIIRGDDANSTIAMISEGRDYFLTEPVPAPRENQKIGFTNIDKGEDLEVMITGEKKGQVGYAVYKLINHDFRNLYGENMKDCC